MTFRKSLSVLMISACIAICALLSVLTGAKIFNIETDTLVSAEALIGVLFLPAYLIALYGWLAKKSALVVVAGILVICHVWWTIPQFVPADGVPEHAADSPRLTLLTHNILWDNDQLELIEDEILQQNADVVFLQEFSSRNLNALRNSSAYTHYPHRYIVPGGVDGIAIWSKFPFENTETLHSPGLPSLRAVVRVGNMPVVLWNVHIASPPGGGAEYWRQDLTALQKRMQQEKGHVIVAGDFNATWTNGRYQDLLQNGYRDAHVESGRGHARTWPAEHGWLARFDGVIRIDHVITSRNVAATRIDEGPGNGSDHRSIRATLALL